MKKYIVGMNDVELNEFSLYEFSKCQLRSFLFSKKNLVLKLADTSIHANKSKSYKAKMYKPYGKTAKYIILKKIYYKTFEILFKRKKITLEDFKNIASVILEKEFITFYKNGNDNFEKMKNKIFSELDEHYSIINEFDLSDSIDKFITYKMNIKKYLTFKFSKINPIYTPNLPVIDWENVLGIPYFKLNIINIKLNEKGLSIVITSPLKVIPEMVHRNFLISFVIEYIYYFYEYNQEIKEKMKNERIDIYKLIVYYPLEKKREEYSFKNINGVMQALELARMIRIYLERLYFRTNDTSLCKQCENNEYCFHRTSAKNKQARKFILNSSSEYKTII